MPAEGLGSGMLQRTEPDPPGKVVGHDEVGEVASPRIVRLVCVTRHRVRSLRVMHGMFRECGTREYACWPFQPTI
jgi:hypothetical protein